MVEQTRSNEDLLPLNIRAIEIINYIKENPGTTENKVAKHMVEHANKYAACSRLTTLKEIDNLIERKIVTDVKEGNKFHRLYINDKNEFNRIDNELFEFENIIDAMDEQMHKIQRITDLQENEGVGLADLRVRLHFPYRDAINMMLQILLLRTQTKIRSKNDSQMLYAKIVGLMLKSNSRFFGDALGTLDIHTNEIKTVKNSNHIMEFAKRRQLNTSVADHLLVKMENFKRRFLKESK